MRTFDIAAPLPGPGVSVLEASAGTGKTWTVAALAARYIAEGVVTLDELLVITFSRAATQELRDRVRESLVRAADGLEDPDGPVDDLVAALRHTEDGAPLPDCEVTRRRDNLRAALADYDAATIATTHEFCSIVLRSLGVAGDTDSTDRLVEDIADLVEEVVDDRFLVTYGAVAEPPVDHRTVRRVARAALANVHARIEPRDATPGSEAAALVDFARDAVEEVETRKRRRNLLTFDDLLGRLADAVDQVPSPAAERMRTRWRVVLVDEFQDTDPVQWRVLQGAFAQAARLVLIGDPKQAIYAFRGGDTPTYLAAVADADQQTLGRNWRSDAAVVDALQVLTHGAALGDQRITVREVRAERDGARLLGRDGTALSGVRLRQLRREDHTTTKSGGIPIGVAREHVARDLAADIASLLSSGATYEGRPVSAGDIAILLHSVKRDGPLVTAQLRHHGVPYVVNTATSVMSGPAAGHWARLLDALESTQRPGVVRAAALTPFFEVTAEALDSGGDELTDRLAERLRSWLDLFRSRGVAAVLAAAQADGLAERVLRRPDGERLLTDLNHVGQLLHEAATTQRLGITGLRSWLREAVEEGDRNDARRRRLDIDAEAVQLVTIHGAKGLEYPIVYLPKLYDEGGVEDWVTIHAYHDDDGARCLDVADSAAAKVRARAEDAEEDLRLAYVAMTRAAAQVVMWWAPTYNGVRSSLTRLLFGRSRDSSAVLQTAEVPASDEGVDEVLRGWADAGGFRWERSLVADAGVLRRTDRARGLRARRFDRTVDTDWRRTSYSGLIRAEEQRVEAGLTSEPEDPGTVDEDVAPVDAGVAATAPAAPPAHDPVPDDAPASPMADLPAGAGFGSLVHAVLEHTDPQAPDLRAELLRHIEEQRRWWSVDVASEVVADALLPLQQTSLGPLAGRRPLRDIPRTDRLCELDFEFPMAGGDRATTADLPLSAVADALRRHLLADDPVRAYADRLDNPSLGGQRLRGYLSGSIDVVLRIPDASVPGGSRFVVVDYKTNRLGDPERPMTAWDYRPEALAEAMLHSHYPLQALLYTVVLHRYLRWRLGAAYDPAAHLGGVLYLYLRGMCGPETPEYDGVPAGVFSWRPPVALVEELSAIMAGGTGEPS
jgi:exodeoxyribonuclease V beta subunit